MGVWQTEERREIVMTVGELLDKLNAAGVTGDMEVMSDTNPVWAAGVDEGVFSIFSIVAQKLWEQREKVWTTESEELDRLRKRRDEIQQMLDDDRSEEDMRARVL